MDVETLQRLRTVLLAEAERITQEKQPGYTLGREDVLSNFKTVAERMGVTPMQAWGVYFLKHVDSIIAVGKDPKIPQAEPLIGRFADAINYLCLGYALLLEPQAVSGGKGPGGGGHSVSDGSGLSKKPLWEQRRDFYDRGSSFPGSIQIIEDDGA